MSLLVPRTELDKLMLADFVAIRTRGHSVSWRDYYSLGWESDGRIVVAVVLCNFDGSGADLHLACAVNYSYAPRPLLFAVFDYAFRTAKLRRITARISRSNARMLRLADHLGFCREGLYRQGSPDGEDQVLLGMLKEECRWVSDDFCGRLARHLTVSA